MNDAGPPLSKSTTDLIRFFFTDEARRTAADLLVRECGDRLPLASSLALIERIRHAALKLAKGDLSMLRLRIAEARRDWRDVLVAAGFGNDLTAHVRWASELAAWRLEVSEVSASVYEVVAIDEAGRRAAFQGTDPDALLVQARMAVLELVGRHG
ncbi:MAG TPA: hypothetical protein VI299_23475 [Polyangiales bacterium]